MSLKELLNYLYNVHSHTLEVSFFIDALITGLLKSQQHNPGEVHDSMQSAGFPEIENFQPWFDWIVSLKYLEMTCCELLIYKLIEINYSLWYL